MSFISMLDPVVNILNTLIDRLVPNKNKAAEFKDKVKEMAVNGEIQSMISQVEINKTEAASPSIFVSGWRPFIGWVCGVSLSYQYVLRPILIFFSELFKWNIPVLPGLDENLWQLMVGMLGLGTLRTFEKVKGATV